MACIIVKTSTTTEPKPIPLSLLAILAGIIGLMVIGRKK